MASSLVKLRGNKARSRSRATLGREVDEVNNDRVRQRSFNNFRRGASEGMNVRARVVARGGENTFSQRDGDGRRCDVYGAKFIR
jgi:hypothetical protein